jgi:hypothetical protein
VKTLGDLLVDLAASLARGAGDAGTIVVVTSVDLTLPVEAHIARGGELLASLPRGRMATGFALPHGRLSARFAAEEAG